MSKQRFISYFSFLALASLIAGSVGVAFAHEGSMHADDVAVTQPALSTEDKRVVKALEQYATAVQAGNIDEIEKYVLTSDVFTSLDGVNQEDAANHEDGAYLDLGWQNYRKHLAAELPMLRDYKYSLNNIRPFVHGDLAYATMGYVMMFTINSDQFESGGRRFTMKGKATMVLWKVNNEWKIRHRHTTPGKT